jgi:hypothetical protein
MKIQELLSNHRTVAQQALSEAVKNQQNLLDNPFRIYSESWFAFFQEAQLLNEDARQQLSACDRELLESDIGTFGDYQGQQVPLDVILEEPGGPTQLDEAEYQGKKVELNRPKRGGSKKYYVYVKNPQTGNIKKVSFGSTELSVKIRDPKRRASFAARHRCADTKDRTSARYWACRLPRFAKGLGLAPVNAQWW